MAVYTAIADVGETLIELLRDRMEDIIAFMAMTGGKRGRRKTGRRRRR